MNEIIKIEINYKQLFIRLRLIYIKKTKQKKNKTKKTPSIKY